MDNVSEYLSSRERKCTFINKWNIEMCRKPNSKLYTEIYQGKERFIRKPTTSAKTKAGLKQDKKKRGLFYS